jgi:hypothetical protein
MKFQKHSLGLSSPDTNKLEPHSKGTMLRQQITTTNNNLDSLFLHDPIGFNE